MSQENVELVRRILELWNGPGVVSDETRSELFDPAIRMDLTGRKINPAVYDGYEGMTRFTSDVGEVWDEFTIELRELIDADPCVVSVMHAKGKLWTATGSDPRYADQGAAPLSTALA